MTKTLSRVALPGLLSLALLALFGKQSANASILFAGGEDSGFTAIVGATGGAAGETGGSYLARSGFARTTSTVVAVFNVTNVADPPASRLQSPVFTSSSNIWIHAQFSTLVSNGTTNGQQALIVRSPDGVARIVLRQTGTAGTVKISTRDHLGAFVDLATASGIFPNATLTPVDLNINYTCSGAGGVSLYLQGTQVINYSGNPCTDAATQLNQIELGSMNGQGSGAVATGGTGWSEVIVADQDTRGMGLWTLNPTAAGNTQSWTPNTLANVNKAIINDATNVSTGSNNALSEWTTPTSPPAGTWNVLAIVQEARMLRGVTGPQNFEWLVRTIDGTDHVTGSVNPSTSFGNFSGQIWATNPHTSAAWVIGDIAAGFNLGIESLP